MTPIVCVSAGMRAPKKRDTPLSRLHLYLNYGLLGLATRLNNSGQPSIVLHGGFSSPESFADIPISYLRKSTKPLLLSLPSSFALGWARDFCAVVKQAVPHSRIVVGGRWVTASDGAWIRRQIPDADLVVYGTAESRIEKLVDPASWSTVGATDRYLLGKSIPNEVQLPALDFRLVDGFLDYQPCIEISRGCGMGCNFCAEASEPLSQPRPVPEVVRELLNLSAVYSGDIHPYFQASFFRPSSQWIDELKARIMARDIMVQWRTETRVDGLAPGQIEGLARAGLKVLDLGLESASLVQLRRMGKTANPETYLRRASNLLKACVENGVWTKVNILLFPGESPATVAETVDWLDRHRAAIKGVSVGPMIVFRYGGESLRYLQSIAEHGAYPVDENDLDRLGYAHVHLSSEMSHEAANETACYISRRFMSQADYFDLKSFSYFPRGFSRRNFSDLVATIPEADLPFVPG